MTWAPASRPGFHSTTNAADRDDACVLVVDDEEGVREALREVVEMAGCSAIEAVDGADALKVLARHRPCLIILDLLMPVMTGAELLDALRKQPELATIPVVVSTSAPGRAPSGFRVLPKPIDIGAVWDCVRAACDCSIVSPESAEATGGH
jgi:two-component system response regulator CpxR